MIVLRVLFLPLSLGILVSSAFVTPLPVFVERPAELFSLGDAVTVAGAPVEVDGDYLLTAVGLVRGTPVRVVGALLDDDSGIVADRRLVPRGMDDAAFFRHQRAVFRVAADVAAAVGLQAAGHPADPHALTGDGALIVQVVPGSPAHGVLAAGDVVTEVDRAPVRTAADLRRALVAGGGATARVTVERDGERVVVEVEPRLDPQQGVPVLGVVPETFQPRVDLPVPVSIDLEQIGGPSAGLLIALTVYDSVADEDLARGRRVAGTGRIDPEGAVLPVGGVRQKVVAALAVGADVFLVPRDQLREATDAAGPGSPLEVVPVGSFSEALAALR